MNDNEALIRRWFEEVWNKRRADAIDEMAAQDLIVHGLSGESNEPMRGIDGFKAFHKTFSGAFSDIVVTVEDTVSEGDKIAARCSVRGKHTGDTLGFAATNEPTEFTGIAIVRIKDGKFVEAWNSFDFMTMHKQLKTI
jgi:steroid delta-isomerase-like uncharacterized protein